MNHIDVSPGNMELYVHRNHTQRRKHAQRSGRSLTD